MADDGPIELNQTQMGEVFGVSTRQVRNWEKDGLVCRAAGNQKFYPLAAAIRWYREREVSAALAEVEVKDIDAAKLRKLEAEADTKELDLAVKRGELVPMDEVGDLVRESLEAVDAVLKHSPSRFAPQLAKAAQVHLKTARTILREVIESVRGAIREGDHAA